MQASRGQRRHHLIYYLQVTDCTTGEQLGFLGDITPGGMQVLSDRPLAVGRRFDLEISGRNATEQPPAVRCRARSIWSRADADPGYYATGFEFEDTSTRTMRAIRALIQDIDFDR